MKKVWFFVFFSVILAAVLISVPVLATTNIAKYTVQGIEIFAGIDIGNSTYGATFVTRASCPSGGGLLAGSTNGTLSASVNYYGPGPKSGGNTIFGGSWTLTITTSGKVGTIMGKIIDGNITWTPSGTTQYGTTHMDLSITGGSGAYKGITTGIGSSFDGHDNHNSGLIIFGITVPTVDGTLNLSY